MSIEEVTWRCYRNLYQKAFGATCRGSAGRAEQRAANVNHEPVQRPRAPAHIVALVAASLLPGLRGRRHRRLGSGRQLPPSLRRPARRHRQGAGERGRVRDRLPHPRLSPPWPLRAASTGVATWPRSTSGRGRSPPCSAPASSCWHQTARCSCTRTSRQTQCSRTEPRQNQSMWCGRFSTTGHPAVGNLQRGQVTGRWVAPVFVPVIRDGQVIYTLGIAVEADRISRMLAGQTFPRRRLCLARGRARADRCPLRRARAVRRPDRPRLGDRWRAQQ